MRERRKLWVGALNFRLSQGRQAGACLARGTLALPGRLVIWLRLRPTKNQGVDGSLHLSYCPMTVNES